MAILPIYLYGQPVLRKKAKQVRVVDEHIVRLAQDMLETMHNAGGIGLAANQVGSLHRVIVADISGTEEGRESAPLVLINPEVMEEEDRWAMEEGCLSIPEIRDEVARAGKIRVKFKDLESRDRELVAEGLMGRVLLHEIDHINGILFIDHLGSVRRRLLRGRLNKIARGEVETTYPVVTEVPAATAQK